MRDFSDFYIKNYSISKIICNFAARNNIEYIRICVTWNLLRLI